MLTAVEFSLPAVGINLHRLAQIIYLRTPTIQIELQAEAVCRKYRGFVRGTILTFVGRSVDMAFSFSDLARALSFSSCLFMNAPDISFRLW